MERGLGGGSEAESNKAGAKKGGCRGVAGHEKNLLTIHS